MGQVCWGSSRSGHYWIDLALPNGPCRGMIDLGLVDPLHKVGASINPVVYDVMKNSGSLSDCEWRFHTHAGGGQIQLETGRTTIQLLDSLSGLPVGPIVQLYISRGVKGVPSRVGVVFFHSLKCCKVAWDLDNQVWGIEYP